MSKEKETSFFWSELAVQIPEKLLIRYGLNEICIHKNDSTIYWAIRKTGENDIKFSSTGNVSDDTSESFNFEILSSGIHEKSGICPVFPDRPIILMFETPFTLNPETNVTFLCSLPVAPAVVDTQSKEIIKEFNTWKLSNTWSGDFEAGDLCFSQKAVFLENRDLENLSPDNAAVLLSFTNKSSSAFRFYKIFLNTPSLKIFHNDKYLSSNKVDIVVSGPSS